MLFLALRRKLATASMTNTLSAMIFNVLKEQRYKFAGAEAFVV
jgi:hypothetical protein